MTYKALVWLLPQTYWTQAQTYKNHLHN